MTTYRLPELTGPVWLTRDADEPPAAHIRYMPRGDGRWQNDEGDILALPELLALGELDDVYPGDYDLHGTATPWSIVEGTEILGADGEPIIDFYTRSGAASEDQALAALVVELVNRHAAGEVATSAAEHDTAAQHPDECEGCEAIAQQRLALAVNEVVLRWQRVTPSTRVEVDRLCPGLGEVLESLYNAHAVVGR